MPNLTENAIYELMKSDAYNNPYHPDREKINEKVKNAFKSLYPDDDRDINPEKYYIWRTEGDNRVRSSHADRDGEVFSWKNPPEGGHPGEDWGCRCWAEEYTPPNWNPNAKKIEKLSNPSISDESSKLVDKMLDDSRLISSKDFYNKSLDSNPDWGNKTQEKLEEYLKEYESIPKLKRKMLLAPFEDMIDNFDEMNRMGLVGSDKFFHCKANFEASQRGLYGDFVAKTISMLKEMKDVAKYGVKDSLSDAHANKKGWDGAKYGKSLRESCPTNPKKYYSNKKI